MFRGLLAAVLACVPPCSEAVEVAGKLLVDLDAADFALGGKRWSQHTDGTGIPGDFMPKGSPTRQMVAGAEAVVFDGDGDYFVGPFTTSALHAPRAKHSVEIWVYQGNVRDQESVVSWGKRWGRPDLSLAAFRYGVDPDLGAIGRWGSSESPFVTVPTPGRWHHLAYTFDGSMQSVYVDGKLDNTRQVGLLDAHDMLPIHLGAEICGDLKLEGTFTQYSGALGKVRIHSGALTEDQVKRNYEAERAGFPGLSAKPLRQAPVHRFSFNESPGSAPNGTLVPDLIGGLSAVVRGDDAVFTGQAVRLPGGSPAKEAYLDFPNGLISSCENLTIEFWETQIDNQVWSRILSFGTNQAGEITGPGGSFHGSETLTLFGNVGAMQINRFARSMGNHPNGGPDRDPAPYPDSDYGTEFHQVITYDKRLAEWHWYRNGLLMEVIPDTEGPSTIEDVNVWLGRSEFSVDNNFHGLFNEVRIYNHALSDSEVYGNFLAGPDKLSLGKDILALNWKPAAPGRYSFVNTPATDNWATGSGGAFPDGSGSTATFASPITGDQEISLDVPIRLGSLNIGSLSAIGAFTLRAGKSGAIAMDSGDSGSASITQPAGGAENRVVAPITVVSDTEISNQSVAPLMIGGSIHGRGTLVKTGSGPVFLTGDGGSYNGQLRVVSGELVLGGDQTVRLPMVSQTVIASPGALVFDRVDDLSIDGEFSGTGKIIQRGTGTLTLSESGFFTNHGAIQLEKGSGALVNEGLIDGAVELRTDSSLILSGRSLTRLGKWLSIGTTDGGILTVRDSANVEIQGVGHLNVGDVGRGQSTLFMEGGSIRCRELFVGKNEGVSGVLLQTGGDIIKEGQLDSRVGGGFPGSYDTWGAWRLLGGTFTDAWNLQIGAYGTGVMEIDGGSLKVNGYLAIGRYEDAPEHSSYGVLDVKSGSVETSQNGNYVLVGEEGTGVINIRGSGMFTYNELMVGAGSIDKPGDGTVNLLSGGTLVTSGIAQMNESAAVGRLLLDGGILRAGNSNATFMEGLDFVHVGKGGALIDTNGHDISINQNLLKPEGKGIAGIPVIRGGGNYQGSPFLKISGGGGSGATAFAELEEGAIRSVTITHPGTGYTSAPTVTVMGGGAGEGLSLGTPVLAANVGGGLTKTGEGTLTLAGNNTYNGLTKVERGTLKVVGNLAGPVEVVSGASLCGSGVIGGSLEAPSGASIAPCPGASMTVRGDVALAGTLSVETTATGSAAGRIDVGGFLDLTGARLSVKPAAGNLAGPALVIANYGRLQGKFTVDGELPAGYVIDYNFNGLKQIALVAANSDAE